MKIKRDVREFIFDINNRPTNNCHASTIVLLNDGTVVCAWFGGTKEGYDDVDIWVSRKIDGVWTIPEIAASMEGEPQWNPVLYLRKDGKLALFYKSGKPIPQWYTMVCFSDDGGKTWYGHRELVPGDIGGRGPVKNKAIMLSNGIVAAPASLEGDRWDAFVDLSADDGETWEMSSIVPVKSCFEGNSVQDIYVCRGKGVIQPTLWESVPGYVHMLLRSTGSYIFRSNSKDYGRTWSQAYNTGLPNNNSGIDLVKMDDGSLVLCCNPVCTPEGQWGGPRTPIVLMVSEDNGMTWKDLYTCEDIDGEFSYPAIIADGKRLLVSYTWRRETIRFIDLELEKR